MSLRDEIDANYRRFVDDWQAKLSSNLVGTATFEDLFLSSYRRLTTLQAWRATLLEQALDPEACSFFLEAQNDALVSHIQARCGAWRSALKSLRSMLENVLLALYYKDHPVELTLWQRGKFRLSFAEIQKYFQHHPDLEEVSGSIGGLGLINQEYSRLSKAVHASSNEFRMSQGRAIAIWHVDEVHMRQWSTHERRSIEAANLLLLALFREKLTGTRQIALRSTVAFAVPKNRDESLRQELGISIRRS